MPRSAFTLPEQSTAWRLLAKGITADTLAGEAAETLTAKKDLFGELKLPPSFTDGDQAEVVASIHNDAIEKGPIQVTLRTTIGGRTVEEKKTIEVRAKGIREVAFDVGTRGEGRGAGDTVDFALDCRRRRAAGRGAAVRAASALRHARLRHGRRRGRLRYVRLGRAAVGHVARRSDAVDPCRSNR